MNDELKTWIVTEFKKGMLEGVKLGRQSERERIFKVIDDLVALHGADGQVSVGLLTMLIEGENATDFTGSALPKAQEGDTK